MQSALTRGGGYVFHGRFNQVVDSIHALSLISSLCFRKFARNNFLQEEEDSDIFLTESLTRSFPMLKIPVALISGKDTDWSYETGWSHWIGRE